MLQKAGHIKNTVVFTILTFQHIQCLHLIYAEEAWVLVASGTHVQPQVMLDPDYLPDYLSILMTMLKQTNRKKKQDWLKSTQQQLGQKTKHNNPKTKNKQNKQTKEWRKKIIQLLTVAPELVSLDCRVTHVLQTPNTHL